MKIAVLVKQTFATEARIVLDDAGGISDAKVKKVVNPYDEFAVEEAIQLREKGVAEKVTVVTLGPDSAADASRHCLAMGADEAVLIDSSEIEMNDSAAVSQVLAAALREIEFDLLLAGCVAVDDNSSQVAVRIAELLDLPQINVVSKIEATDSEVVAWREADGQTEVMTASLPALVTTDKGINKPRYPTLPNIMKAKKKPLVIRQLSDLGIAAPAPKIKISKIDLPPAKEGAKIFGGTPSEAAAALAQALRNEAKVI